MNETIERRRRSVIGPVSGRWGRRMIAVLRDDVVIESGSRDLAWPADRLTIVGMGARMEQMKEEISVLNGEVSEARDTVRALANEVAALANVIEPQLLDCITRTRSARMAIVTELRQSLDAMRDVRKFFLESDYRTEMERLEQFIAVARELEALKQSGVLDALCDTAIRLALKENQP